MEDEARELIVEQGIRAFPTFRFYIDGAVVDEVQGADIESVKSKVRHFVLLVSWPTLVIQLS
jgi:hypothetical protein